jgi:hypothetical protein
MQSGGLLHEQYRYISGTIWPGGNLLTHIRKIGRGANTHTSRLDRTDCGG